MNDLEQHLIAKHRLQFPATMHADGPFPQWDCELDWGKGGNWKDNSKNKTRENTNHQKVPTFVYDLRDETRILAVARACKDRTSEYVNVPICIFCTHFFVLLPPKSNTLTY